MRIFKNKLATAFLIWFGAMVVILALIFPEHREVDYSIPQFRTSQADLLYFKNIRAYYYHKVEEEKSGYDILRIKSFYKDSTNTPNLTFAIINNWRQDETYVMAEWHGDLVFDKPLILEWQSAEENGKISLDSFDNESHFKFAGEVYSHLIAGHELTQNNTLIYSAPQTKTAIKTLKDYFKLIGKIY